MRQWLYAEDVLQLSPTSIWTGKTHVQTDPMVVVSIGHPLSDVDVVGRPI